MAEESSAHQLAVARSPALTGLERWFALDQPIAPKLWQSVRQTSGAKHALLVRPERLARMARQRLQERANEPANDSGPELHASSASSPC
jgi:hypothetical protein